MRKMLFLILTGLILIVATILIIRFLFGGNEDAWICNKDEWVKHGNPLAPKPAEKCGEKKETLTPQQEYIIVKIFFGNSQKDPEVLDCKLVFPTERKILKTKAVAKAAMEELLKGPTETEKNENYFTSINEEVKIQKLTIENGVAKIDFNERLQFQVGGSCRVAAIRAQITETLKQFPTVKEVIISINGETETILQP